ncbi:LytTR family DNA-binding domain-containing protein [Lunatimonas salinarum]|uniref:LytTR family DNA-binding domain-containing protein n=1 Tax=Lunatimonas salinarum TaxID=1774590 RepID=UPI001AE0B895|nr:LytTR family DNA-binding domain-containing protein [Lunatimonas salinarum]
MKTESQIVLIQNSVYRRLVFEDLIFVEVTGYMLTCWLEGGETYFICRSLKCFKESLPSEFIQISRAKIVNFGKVIKFDKKSRVITLADKSKHKVSVRQIPIVLKAFND